MCIGIPLSWNLQDFRNCLALLTKGSSLFSFPLDSLKWTKYLFVFVKFGWTFENSTFIFASEKQLYLPHFWWDQDFQGTVVNRVLLSCKEGHLKLRLQSLLSLKTLANSGYQALKHLKNQRVKLVYFKSRTSGIRRFFFPRLISSVST